MADDKTFTQADIDAAVSKAVGDLDGLKDNLKTALDEAKDAKRKLRAASEIKPEDVAALESELETVKGKLTAAEKTATEATKAKEKAEGALKGEQTFTHKLLVENGLREQLVAAGVTHPAHQKGAIAMLASQVQVATDGENRVAKVGDKALADYVKEWAGTDEGKAFVSAPNNGGGGAGGSKTTTSTAKTMTRSAFSALSQQEQGELGAQMTKGDLKLVDD